MQPMFLVLKEQQLKTYKNEKDNFNNRYGGDDGSVYPQQLRIGRRNDSY